MVPARKQRSWESTLLATGRPASGGDLAHLRLLILAERKAHARKRLGAQRGEHVGLVLGGIGRDLQQAVLDAGVMAGGERRAAQAVGELEHRVEPHVAVTADAGVWGVTCLVGGDERLDHAAAELLTEVQREVWKADLVGERAGLGDRARGAAALLRVILGVGPELEGHRDRLPLLAGRGAPRRWSRRRPTWPQASWSCCGPAGPDTEPRALTAAPSARASASAATDAAWCLPGLRPPSSVAIASAPTRAASSSVAPRTSVTAAEAAACEAPQPLALKPASVTRVPSVWMLKVTSSQHSPPPKVTVKAFSGVWPSPCGRGQVVLEGKRCPCLKQDI